MSVNVSLPRYLGEHRGKPVTSGIAKLPVTTDDVGLDHMNLEGDGQADPSVHGGEDKAVYAYPSEHLPWWRQELEQALDEPAPFGENLSTEGATENGVVIGERWAWGTAVLEVCQPRWPCHKLIRHRGTAVAAELLVETGRCGWYLRVLREGRVPVDGPIEVLARPVAPSVLDCMRARTELHHGDPARAAELVMEPLLAAQWRSSLEAALRSHRSTGN